MFRGWRRGSVPAGVHPSGHLTAHCTGGIRLLNPPVANVSVTGCSGLSTMEPMFVHLRLHTEYSVVDGTNRIDEVAKAAAVDGQPALAITDLNNLFGAIKFYKEARGKGVKPLLGAEIFLEGEGTAPPSRMIVLVQNRQGYLSLSELLARAWTRNIVKNLAVCTWEWLQELSEGLIVLSGAQAGPVGQALLKGDDAGAADTALRTAGLFRTASTWSCSAPAAPTTRPT